nr:hypothetical protein [Actinomyces sp.]
MKTKSAAMLLSALLVVGVVPTANAIYMGGTQRCSQAAGYAAVFGQQSQGVLMTLEIGGFKKSYPNKTATLVAQGKWVASWRVTSDNLVTAHGFCHPQLGR